MARHRILQVITRADWGGAQRHVFDLATHLDSDHFEVSVACAPDGPLVDHLRGRNIRIIPIKSFQRGLSAGRDMQAFDEVRQAIALVRPGLVHSHSSKAGILGRLAARLAGRPAVYTAHGFAFGGHASSRLARALYLGAEWCAGHFFSDCIIAVSEADRQLALSKAIIQADKIVTINNGVDCDAYMHIPVPMFTGRVPVVGTITRLVAGKGLVEFIEAASVLLKRRTYRFVLAGDGPLAADLKTRVKRLGIENEVHFPGVVDPMAMLPEIDLFVLPSLKEGLPYSILEAMAAGRAVIATPVGGIPELIQDGENGRLVPIGSVLALAKAIEDLASPEALSSMGNRARETVRKRFGINSMIQETSAVYARLLE